MFKAVAIAAAALSFAGAAQAHSVTVQLAGSDRDTVHRQIVRAAHHVCAAQFWDAPLAYYVVPSCVRATVRDAEARLSNDAIVASASNAGREFAATLR